jgi:hypothetical protein
VKKTFPPDRAIVIVTFLSISATQLGTSSR